MLKVDFRRAFTMPLYYIMVGASFVMPILILVMTTMMGDMTTVDPVTGVETTMETFTNVWQAIAAASNDSAAGGMSLTGMCNINMLYFLAAVFVCIFIADDFRSGYAKNLFTVRSKKTDYVISKLAIGFVGGVSMLLAYFIGAMLGGKIAGLPFDLGGVGVMNVFACMVSKIFLMSIFVAVYVTVSVAGKQRLWLSLIGSFAVGMLFFMMIPMITPLDATAMHVLLTFVGGGLFSAGLGGASNLILKKTSLV